MTRTLLSPGRAAQCRGRAGSPHSGIQPSMPVHVSLHRGCARAILALHAGFKRKYVVKLQTATGIEVPMRLKRILLILLAGILVSGCASSPLCGAAGAAGGAYAGHELGDGDTGATVGGAAGGGALGALACD